MIDGHVSFETHDSTDERQINGNERAQRNLKREIPLHK